MTVKSALGPVMWALRVNMGLTGLMACLLLVHAVRAGDAYIAVLGVGNLLMMALVWHKLIVLAREESWALRANIIVCGLFAPALFWMASLYALYDVTKNAGSL